MLQKGMFKFTVAEIQDILIQNLRASGKIPNEACKSRLQFVMDLDCNPKGVKFEVEIT